MHTSSSYQKKGGRPRKENPMDQQLAVMCTMEERKIMEAKAKSVNVSISEFLRTLGLKGQVDRKIKVLPKEVLAFTATLNHIAANINQLARSYNQTGSLNEQEYEHLKALTQNVKQLAADIKNHLQ